VRDLQFVVSDGATFAVRETDATLLSQEVKLGDGRTLEYRQVNSDKDGKYRITKTYVTDPARSTVLVDVTFESLDGNPYQLYVLYDPSLNNGGDDDTASSQNGQLLASDGKVASALVSAPRFAQASSGAPPTSVGSSGSLEHTTYDVSAMTLAAHEDKTYRGAYIASPTMPWVWGTGLENPSGAYHLLWSRDLYQIATALLAANDRAGADRALTYLFERQQKSDGSFPQNSTVDGTPHWGNTQLDEVAFPIVLAWQLGRTGGTTYRGHIKPAADYIVANGPATPQERWENQGGYSPATIASEIAGLVCAADIARANGDRASSNRYLRIADDWQRSVEKWTVTTNGPLASHPYYLRITKDGNPNAGTTYNIGDSGPNSIDQRRVVDTSYLELVRLGVKAPDDPNIVQTLDVVDLPPNVLRDNQKVGLKFTTSNGYTYWHCFNFDGYGETRTGGPWDIGYPACNLTTCLQTQATIGRVWPIFAGERGEYELAAGQAGAAGRLASVAKAGNEGYKQPEQVWDDFLPSGQPGFTPGEGTFSATPLAWTHAQFVRLAWSIQDGRPVEQPRIVACRYTENCPD
jgi:glucoamylase